MSLGKIFKIEFVSEDLQAKTKEETLIELVKNVIQNVPKLDPSKVIDVLQHREKLGSTGIGYGVAIPHGKIISLDEIIVAFGRSKQGVPFDSVDNKPVHLFFLLLAPEKSSGLHLKVLAKISKMLKSGSFREKLINAKSRQDIFKTIIDQDDDSII
jgi:PTS system nitrogen regulatory IIA component